MALTFGLTILLCSILGMTWCVEEMTESEMSEAVLGLVKHFHHPCAVIVAPPGLNITIKNLIKEVQVQVVDRLERMEELDTDCGHFVWLGEEQVVKLLDRMGEQRLTSGVWYVMGGLEEELLQPLHIRFDSQLYFLRRTESKFDLVEVYDITAGGRRMWTTVGTLDPSTLEVSVRRPDLWHRRTDLGGLGLRTVVLPWCDFLCLEEGGLEDWYGLVPDIWNSLARSLNFTYTLARSSDGKWGGHDKVTTVIMINFSIFQGYQRMEWSCRRPHSGQGRRYRGTVFFYPRKELGY